MLPGIGEKRAQSIKQLGLETVGDVLFSYPRTYKDFTQVVQPHQVEVGVEQLTSGPLTNLYERRISGQALDPGTAGHDLNLVCHRGPGSSYLSVEGRSNYGLWCGQTGLLGRR